MVPVQEESRNRWVWWGREEEEGDGEEEKKERKMVLGKERKKKKKKRREGKRKSGERNKNEMSGPNSSLKQEKDNKIMRLPNYPLTQI